MGPLINTLEKKIWKVNIWAELKSLSQRGKEWHCRENKKEMKAWPVIAGRQEEMHMYVGGSGRDDNTKYNEKNRLESDHEETLGREKEFILTFLENHEIF